jgi:hypothetical protein
MGVPEHSRLSSSRLVLLGERVNVRMEGKVVLLVGDWPFAVLGGNSKMKQP